MMIRTAKCCCGKTSIELDGDPLLNLVCHCNNCRSRTGSAFGMSCYFSNNQVISVTGEMNVYKINNADTEQKRYFCGTCGTTLYWKLSRFPGLPNASTLTGVAGGCFPSTSLPPPTISAQDGDRHAWLALQFMDGSNADNLERSTDP